MSAYRETKLHGTHGFPYIVYLGIIPEYTGGVALHWHEEMEIIYVTEGTVQVSVRQSDHVLSNGDIVLVHPQTIHAIRQYGESSARYYNITQPELFMHIGNCICKWLCMIKQLQS